MDFLRRYFVLPRLQRRQANAVGKTPPRNHLEVAIAHAQEVQILISPHCSPSPRIHRVQCAYLGRELADMVQSIYFLYWERKFECIFEYICILFKEVKTFVIDCCKDEWIQTAIMMGDPVEYVSLLSSDLQTLRVYFRNTFRWDNPEIIREICVIDPRRFNELAICRQNASIDREELLSILATLDQSQYSDDQYALGSNLLRRLRCGYSEGDDTTPHSITNIHAWEISYGALNRQDQLGEGASAVVHRTTWIGESLAEKTFPNDENFLTLFRNELSILVGLSHPNILPLYCYASDSHTCSLVVKLMDHNLSAFIDMKMRERETVTAPFDILEAIGIMLQIAEGMDYLHRNKVVHRDLKPDNILVKLDKAEGEYDAESVRVRVANFGLLKIKEMSRTLSNQTLNIGTTKWMAPELYPASQNDHMNTTTSDVTLRYPFKVDVYSFGIICYEVLSGQRPFHNIPLTAVRKRVLEGLRPELPEECPSNLAIMIQRCWELDPSARPSFSEISADLRYEKALVIFGKKPPRNHLEIAEAHAQEVQILISADCSPSPRIHRVQCEYLGLQLRGIVQILRLHFSGTECSPSYEQCKHSLKYICILSKEVKAFVIDCCKDEWIQTAIMMGDPVEYVSLLSSGLQTYLGFPYYEFGPQRRVDELVRQNASIDREELLSVLATLDPSQYSDDQYALGSNLLRRLRCGYSEGDATTPQSINDIHAWEISYQALKRGEKLAGGASASVHRTTWIGESLAQKTFPNDEYFLTFFRNELSILVGLSHPNILPLYCYASDWRTCSLVVKLMDHNLSAFIDKKMRERETVTAPFDILEAIGIMLQIAEGMDYLHRNKVVHRDLKPDNILVELDKAEGEYDVESVRVRVADFGLSRIKEMSRTLSNQTLNIGTTRWMAPELYPASQNDHMNTTTSDVTLRYPFKVDVYSFGIICYEVLSGQRPFHNIPLTAVRKRVLEGLRPELPEECPSNLAIMIQRCWELDPSARPSFSEISADLRYEKALVIFGKKPPRNHLEVAEADAQEVQILISPHCSPSPRIHRVQCAYLVRELLRIVQILRFHYSGTECSPSYEQCKHSLKYICILSREVKTFVIDCCKDEWIQTAIMMGDPVEYVSLLSSDLQTFRVYFRNTFRWDNPEIIREICVIDPRRFNELAICRQNASIDREELLSVLATLDPSQYSDDQYALGSNLLRRLRCGYSEGDATTPHSITNIHAWEISYRDLIRQDQLGKGATAVVHRTTWIGESLAQKTFPNDEYFLTFFRNELSILVGLSHPNILPLYCYASDWRTCSLVVKLMDHNLSAFIDMKMRERETVTSPFDILEAIGIMLQIAEGMDYLHRNKVVHRDLKPDNILVKLDKAEGEHDVESVRVSVADFGLSRIKEMSRTLSNQTLNIGTTKWMAPELYPASQNDHMNTTTSDVTLRYPFKVDVYSFGIICYEVLSGQRPFHNIPLTAVRKRVLEGLRPELPEECPSNLAIMIQRCWELDPSARPSFSEISADLRYEKALVIFGKKPPRNHLEIAEAHAQEVQKLISADCSPSPRIHQVQCEYLGLQLRGIVQILRLHFSGTECSPSYEQCKHSLKYICILSKAVKTFVIDCCKDEWIQTAIMMGDPVEYVSSLSADLETYLSFPFHEFGPQRRVDELVRQNASIDREELLSILATLDPSQYSDDQYALGSNLLRRLRCGYSEGDATTPQNSNDIHAWEISYQALKRGEKLAGGASASVHRTTWIGESLAQKTFPNDEYFLTFFRNELSILVGLSHPNILPLYCYASDWRTCSLVVKLMDHNLSAFIDKKMRERETVTAPFDILEAIGIMLQIAEGMDYLHRNKVVHRDLKPDNILVELDKAEGEYDVESVRVRVADFGLSRIKEMSRTLSYQTLNIGTTKWMAPELYPASQNDHMNTTTSDVTLRYPFKVDVYSFGMVCYEVLSGQRPFHNIPLTAVRKRVLEGLRPELPEECPSNLAIMIQRCWELDPSARPSFSEISADLRYEKALVIFGKRPPRNHLEVAEADAQEVQILISPHCSPSPRIHRVQCAYLGRELIRIVQILRFHFSGTECSPSYEQCKHSLKYICILSKAVKTFVIDCCKDEWIQTAIMMGDPVEYVSLLSSDLETYLGFPYHESGPQRRVDELVRQNASIDREELLSVLATLDPSQYSDDQYALGSNLLRRLRCGYSEGDATTPQSINDIHAWEISYQALNRREKLAGGASASVHRTTWIGESLAQKTFANDEYFLTFFRNELSILVGLSHPNILPLYCYASDWRTCSLVVKLMDHNLSAFIDKKMRERETVTAPFDILEAIGIMLQIAEGMDYLHRNKVVHRDLKPDNILVELDKAEGEYDVESVRVRVADFGLSRIKEMSRTLSNQTLNIGTTKWMAPELYPASQNDHMNTTTSDVTLRYPFKVDVYSFGMVCYEVLSGQRPFHNIPLTAVRKRVLEGLRPELPEECPSNLAIMIQRCWELDPSARPSFSEISADLRYEKALVIFGM